MSKIFIPAGKLSSKRRDFKLIVSDIRHAVFSVVRLRPIENGKFQMFTLGSGFFVSSSVFVTCRHVLDSPKAPHQEGDQYVLVNNLNGKNGIDYKVGGVLGTDLHLFPELDFAIIICKAKPDQAYIPIGYAHPAVGAEIGIAGYPLATFAVSEAGGAVVDGLVYRVAKGTATAVYRTKWDAGDGYPQNDTSVVEVNFLFVPGNSGGPIFDAETGRAFAYVEGFQNFKIAERNETCNQITPPVGFPTNYVSAVYAVYSIGLTLDRVREHLERFGVNL